MDYSPEDMKRIRKAAKLTQEKMAEMLDLTRESINRMEKGGLPISRSTAIILKSLESDKKSQKDNLIPLYDVEAIAGNEYEVEMMPVTRPKGMIDVGDFLRDSECAIRIYGNSMTPNYPSGCIVGLKAVKDGIVDFGNVYVIETEDNRFFKRLYKAKDKKGYECYSDNTKEFTEGPRKGQPFYEPFVITFDKIKRLYRVIGMIKRNENSAIFGNSD